MLFSFSGITSAIYLTAILDLDAFSNLLQETIVPPPVMAAGSARLAAGRGRNEINWSCQSRGWWTSIHTVIDNVSKENKAEDGLKYFLKLANIKRQV